MHSGKCLDDGLEVSFIDKPLTTILDKRLTIAFLIKNFCFFSTRNQPSSDPRVLLNRLCPPCFRPFAADRTSLKYLRGAQVR